MVAFEEAANRMISGRSRGRQNDNLLVVVGTDPGSGGDHGHNGNDYGHNTPAEDDFRCVVGDVVLECADDRVDEPCNTRDGTARVNTAEML